ncbi:MAG: M17 family metallopeptidase [Vampirovibrionales bacterium]
MPNLMPTLLVSNQCPVDLDVATVVYPLFAASTPEGDDDATPRLAQSHALDALSDSLGECVYALAQAEKFTAGFGKTLTLRLPAGKKIKRFVLLGLGEAKKLNREKLATPFTNAFKLVSGWDASLQSVGISVPAAYQLWGGSLNNDEATQETIPTETIATAIVSGLYGATYKARQAKKAPTTLPKVVLLSEHVETINAVLALAHAVNEGRALAKDLVNYPANLKFTDTLVEAAQAIADAHPERFSINVVSDIAVLEKEMPCFFEVAKGSLASDPPKFVHLTYKGAKPTRKLALVGKSLVFDTGGYQVKPGDFMNTMKGDMGGGAGVLGTAKALGILAPEHLEVHCFFAITPNRIDAGAMVPDSIVDTTCGKKVEIRHTDAEGRLTLIDAVTKASAVEPEVIVTVATLTGAAMVAVGRTIAMMGNNPHWLNKVYTAAKTSGEPVQVFDVTPDDYDTIKSKTEGADLRNSTGKRSRGAQTAAAFVMSGAKPATLPMVHLDIAGADMDDNENATAYSVGTLLQFVLNEV